MPCWRLPPSVPTGAFVVVLSNLPGRGAGERLVIRVNGFQAVLIQGMLEPDWFLSEVLFLTPLGEQMTPGTTALKLGRIVVLGTNSAFLEVIGGEVVAEWPSSVTDRS